MDEDTKRALMAKCDEFDRRITVLEKDMTSYARVQSELKTILNGLANRMRTLWKSCSPDDS